MQGLKDLEAILSVMPMDEEKKKIILESSKVFFEYREYMKDKHGISDEAVEAMTNAYVQTKLMEDKDMMDKVMEGDMSPIAELAEQQAKEEGFDKPIAESMNVFMNFYKEMGKGGL